MFTYLKNKVAASYYYVHKDGTYVGKVRKINTKTWQAEALNGSHYFAQTRKEAVQRLFR